MTFTSSVKDILMRLAEFMHITPNNGKWSVVISALITIGFTLFLIFITNPKSDRVKRCYNYSKLIVAVLLIVFSFSNFESSANFSMVIDICIVAVGFMALVFIFEMGGIVYQIIDDLQRSVKGSIYYAVAAAVSGFTFRCGLQQVVNLLSMVN